MYSVKGVFFRRFLSVRKHCGGYNMIILSQATGIWLKQNFIPILWRLIMQIYAYISLVTNQINCYAFNDGSS